MTDLVSFSYFCLDVFLKFSLLICVGIWVFLLLCFVLGRKNIKLGGYKKWVGRGRWRGNHMIKILYGKINKNNF